MPRTYLEPLKERLDSGLPLDSSDCYRLIRRIEELEGADDQLAEANTRIQQLAALPAELKRQVILLKSGSEGWAASAAEVVAEKLAIPSSEVGRIATLIRREWDRGIQSALVSGNR